MYNNLKVKVVDIKDIKKISDASIEKLSSAINDALSELREELGDKKYQSDIYTNLLQMSSLYGNEYIIRERDKYIK